MMRKIKEQNEHQSDKDGESKKSISCSSVSSENSIIRKMNLGASKKLTKLYKKLYGEMTHKAERKRQRQERKRMELSKSRSSSSSNGLIIIDTDTVNNSYTDSDDDTSGKLFVTKMAKLKMKNKPST